MKRTVMVPIDLVTDAHNIIEFAAGTRERGIAHAILVHVIDTSGQEGPIIEKNLADARTKLEIYAQILRDVGMVVTTRVSTGNLTHEALSIAQRENVDVILCESSAKQPLARLFEGSLSEELAFGQKAPTLLIRDDLLDAFNDPREASLNWSKRLVVPADYSAPSIRAIMQCAKFDSEAVGEVRLLHVITKVEAGDDLEQYIIEDKFRLSAFAAMLEKLGIETVSLVVESDSVGDAVLKEVQASGATGIVMGTKDSGAFTEIIAGSTTLKIMKNTPVPVMVVP
ncbi:MAG: universal stress protein [Coriobacteriia bacterium]|nr:universal stress protein [Coriobacteriia bacterium]